MFEDRSVKEYEGKVREVDTVVKKLEIRSNMDIENILASHLVESKKQFQAMYENLILQLASANKEKNYAAGATERLKAKLEEKRSLKPGKIAITRQKTPTKIKAKFLSSEKLRNLTKSKTPLLRVLKKPEP